MAPEMGDSAERRAEILGFRSFSAYVQQLIRADLISQGTLELREQPPTYKTNIAKPKKPE